MLTKPIHQFLTHSTLCPPHNHQTPHRNTSITGRRYSTHRLAGSQVVKHGVTPPPMAGRRYSLRSVSCLSCFRPTTKHDSPPIDATRQTLLYFVPLLAAKDKSTGHIKSWVSKDRSVSLYCSAVYNTPAGTQVVYKWFGVGPLGISHHFTGTQY